MGIGENSGHQTDRHANALATTVSSNVAATIGGTAIHSPSARAGVGARSIADRAFVPLACLTTGHSRLAGTAWVAF